LILTKLKPILNIDKIPLFNPEKELKMLIDLVIVSYNSFFLISKSISVCFNTDFNHYEHLFHEIATGVWITEMLIGMNTIYYHDGHFITNRKKII
jgi:hypothetical protein